MVGTCDVDSPFQNQERLKKKKSIFWFIVEENVMCAKGK